MTDGAPLPLDEILERAAELTPQARDAFLQQACGTDESLLAEARSLVSVLHESRNFLAGEAHEVGLRLVGQYTLGRVLGAGGMGTVYLGERADGEFQRQVAVKIAHSGLQTPEIVQRFHREKKVLARLDHPNIARLIDGGTTDDGRPYLIMDYVEGEPIDRYCDQQRLPVSARVELVRTVAAAVEHAHCLQIVHRDIKPANVLVDRTGRVKLLDFGIAKVLAPTDRIEDTQTGMQRLTPRYASPEQILHREITPASDVYSLGVMLYELLTGGSPYEADTSPLELSDAVVRKEPGRPSDRARRTGAAVVLARGEANSASLAGKLRGDLDQIVMRALAKAPTQRYPSAAEFSQDLDRHLRRETVEAMPVSLRTKARRFLNRNALALHLRAGRAAREIETQKQVAETMAGMLQDVIQSVDPRLAQGRDIALLRSVLDATAQRVRRELGSGTLVVARLHMTIGNAYQAIGAYDLAESHLSEALATRRTSHAQAADLADSLARLGAVLTDRSRHAEARTLLEDALATALQIDPRDLALEAGIHRDLGKVYDTVGDDARAEEHLLAAIELGTEASGRDSIMVIESIGSLAYFLTTRDQIGRSEPLAREVVELARASGDRPTLAEAVSSYGFFLRWTHRYSAAEREFREALGLAEMIFGSSHPRVATVRIDLASVIEFQGRFQEAYDLYVGALEIQKGSSGVRSLGVGTTLNNIGSLLSKMGRLVEAQDHLDEAISIYRQRLGEGHTWVVVARTNRVVLLHSRGDFEAAEREVLALIPLSLAHWPEDHWRLAILRSLQGVIAVGLGRVEEGEALVRSSLQRLEETLGPEDARTREARDRLESALGPRG